MPIHFKTIKVSTNIWMHSVLSVCCLKISLCFLKIFVEPHTNTNQSKLEKLCVNVPLSNKDFKKHNMACRKTNNLSNHQHNLHFQITVMVSHIGKHHLLYMQIVASSFQHNTISSVRQICRFSMQLCIAILQNRESNIPPQLMERNISTSGPKK